MYYFLILSIIIAGFGGNICGHSDIIDPGIRHYRNEKIRTMGIALMEMAIGIGNLFGGISAGYLIQSIEYMRTACFACVVKEIWQLLVKTRERSCLSSARHSSWRQCWWAVATHFEKITHFENFFQSALNLGPNQRTLKKFSKCVKNVHQHYFRCNLLTHFEKKISTK